MQKKIAGKLIGYARVSTEDQDLKMQVDALEKAGCWNIYTEKRSATRGPRPKFELALIDLRPGDTLVAWKYDRLFRTPRDLYKLLDRLEELGASAKSLTEDLDITTPVGELMLGLTALLAQFEVRSTSQRTAAGIKAIQERGMRYGAKPKLSEARAKQLVKLRKGGLTKAVLAKRFGVSPASVTNYVNRAKRRKR